MEDFMKQKTECAVCFSVLKEPRILPCLHTFCLECLDKIRDGSVIKCPYCSTSNQYCDMKVDFNAQEMVDVRLKQEQNAQNNTPTKRTRKQHLENYCRDIELLIDDFKTDKTKLQNFVAKILETKSSTLKESNNLRDKSVEQIHAKFDELDSQIIDYCRVKSDEAEKTTEEICGKITQLEQELVTSREAISMETSTEVTMDYVRQLSAKLTSLSVKPDLPEESELRVELARNEEWANVGVASLRLPQQSGEQGDNEGEDDNDSQTSTGCTVMSLTQREFKLLQERPLETSPYSVRVVHGSVWICSDHVISVHAGEIQGLEVTCKIQGDEFGKKIYDVAELCNDQAVVAAEKGLFIVYVSGQIMKKLANGRHTSVKCYQEKTILTVGDLETSALAVLYKYKQATSGQWKRDHMIYLPETCERGDYITLECNDALIHVCNADSDRLYLLTWNGDVISEHGVRTTIRMEKAGGFIAYNFNNSIEKKHCSYSGIISRPRVCFRDHTGLLIADHDDFRFQVFDPSKKLWHTVKLPPMACAGAVMCGDKLYVICRFSDVQLGAHKYNIMKNCLQLYSIL